MLESESAKRRNVIPRWNSLQNSSSFEKGAVAKDHHVPAFVGRFLERAQTNWKIESSPEAAVDLLDATMFAGDQRAAVLAAAQVIAHASVLAPRVVEAASRIFRAEHSDPFDFDLDVHSAEAANEAIRRLRHWTLAAPRDSIALVELARLQALYGSRDAAQRAMSQALHIDPDSRFVLRAATRLFTFVDEGEKALHYLRRSDRIKVDPLIQSAEIATAELMDSPSRIALRALRAFSQQRDQQLVTSELGMSLATLEEKNGAKRSHIDRLILKALSDPTENALAQAVWLTEHTNRQFADRFPNVEIPVIAHEATTLQAIEDESFPAADSAGSKWFASQPFQSRAPLTLAGVNFSYLNRFDRAAVVADAGLKLHAKDWRLLNIATIAHARAGNIPAALDRLSVFRSVASSNEQLAFLNAALGVIDFQEGRFEIALDHYKKAIEHSRKAARNDLIMTAGMHFTELGVQKGALNAEEALSIVQALDKQMTSKSPWNTNDVKRLWKIKRGNILQKAEEVRRLSEDNPAQLPFGPPDILELTERLHSD